MVDLLDLNGLRLEIFVQTFQSAFAAVPGLLDAAERSVGRREVPVVHGNGASLEQAGHPESPRDVFGVDTSCQR